MATIMLLQLASKGRVQNIGYVELHSNLATRIKFHCITGKGLGQKTNLTLEGAKQPIQCTHTVGKCNLALISCQLKLQSDTSNRRVQKAPLCICQRLTAQSKKVIV